MEKCNHSHAILSIFKKKNSVSFSVLIRAEILSALTLQHAQFQTIVRSDFFLPFTFLQITFRN